MKPRRHGFSLLEVLLAMGILLGSLVVLADLAGIGRAHIRSAEDFGTAVRICQTRVDELLAGLRPLEPVDAEPVAEEPGWLCSVEVEPLRQPGLLAVRVTAFQEKTVSGQPAQLTLVRWVRDPRAMAEAEVSIGRGGGGFWTRFRGGRRR
ncbi:MAG: type IV pilus modification PilV family protein [Thermoguttaceae bacterium]